MDSRIMKIRQHSEDTLNINYQACFFLHLPSYRVIDIFIIYLYYTTQKKKKKKPPETKAPKASAFRSIYIPMQL